MEWDITCVTKYAHALHMRQKLGGQAALHAERRCDTCFQLRQAPPNGRGARVCCAGACTCLPTGRWDRAHASAGARACVRAARRLQAAPRAPAKASKSEADKCTVNGQTVYSVTLVD